MTMRRIAGWVGCLSVALAMTVGGTPENGWSAPAQTAPAQPSGGGPLVVVFDLSGSMNDDDGTGTVKLAGAKESLVGVVKTQADRGQRVGLWTYPAGASTNGCQAGSWVTPVGYQNPESISATINALTADGNTPTGPALRAVADSLKADSNVPAVILLVSDGLSNCGPPPCDVARELVSEGFDVTVQAMGFQIDAAGRDELTCVAEATSGSYYDVSDADDLREKIEEYGLPNLDLKVDAPQTVASGDVVTITATVANTSAQAIPDVDIAMIPLDSGDQTVFPAIIPPRVLVGNLPGEESRAYAWRVPVGSINKSGTAKFRVIAASKGYVGAVSHDFTITALGPDSGTWPGTWLSTVVADGSTARIAIFGDSYSSGEGAGEYVEETASSGINECHRSNKTYLSDRGLDVVNVACSGAVTANVVLTEQWGQAPQILDNSLTDVDHPVDAAFMTIGGNDMGFASILVLCIAGADFGLVPDCDVTFSEKPKQIPQLKPLLKDSYQQVYAAINTPELIEARNGRIAPLIILPYPDIVPRTASGACGLDDGELQFAQQVLNGLNKTVEESVNEVRSDAKGSGFSYDGVLFASPVRYALGVHGICAEDSHMNNPTLLRALPDVVFSTPEKAGWGHPTAQGYADITRAIQTWSYTQTLDPTAVGKPEPLQRLRWAPDSAPKTVAVMDSSEVSARQGDSVRVTASGLGPNSPVVVSASSWRYALGTAWADAEGNLDTVVGIPAFVPPGKHHLVVEGFDSGLQTVTYSSPLRIGQAVPWWVAAGPVVVGALFVVGLALLLIARVARPRGNRGRQPAT